MTTTKTAAQAAEYVLVPCHYCGAPCREVVLERGGDNGWGDDKSRTVRKYAAPVRATGGELRERLLAEAGRREAVPSRVPTMNPAMRFAHPERLRDLLSEAAAALSPAIAPGGAEATHWSARHQGAEYFTCEVCGRVECCPELHPAAALATPQDGEAGQPVGDVSTKYAELIYAVGQKWPGETRHETALRYIRQAEEHTDHGPAQEAASGDQ